MAETKEIIRGGLYITLGSIIAFIFSYLFRIVLAKNFSIEEYGLFYSIYNFITFFLPFVCLGLDQSSIHYIVKYKTEENYNKIKTVVASTFFFQLATNLLFILLIFIFSSYLENDYFHYENSGYYLKLMLILIFFNLLVSVSVEIIYGFQKTKVFSLYAPIQNFLYFILTICFMYFGRGLSSPFLAYIAATILLTIIFTIFARKYFNFFQYKIVQFRAITKELFVFGLPMILTGFSARIMTQTDTLMLTSMTSLKEVGLYNAALPLATIFMLVGSAIVTVTFPLFTELWHRNAQEKIGFYLKYIYKYLFLLILPITVVLIIFRDFLLRVMFGPEYLAAGTALIFLVISTIFVIFSGINLTSINAFGYPKLVSKIIFLGAIINIILNYILINIWGINGAALATMISYMFLFIYSIYSLRKYISFQL
ncbi:MAG: flippase, partial [Nanoarchaeota archaeon]